MIIDPHNSNRYRLLVSENDGSTTAYCFSAPIYNMSSRRLVQRAFRPHGGEFTAVGSNAVTTAGRDRIQMENAEGVVSISAEGQPVLNGRGLSMGNADITPTLNGMVYRARSASEGITLTLKTDRPFLQIRSNERCFALMSGEFRPFMTISALGVTDQAGLICAPASLGYRKLDDRTYVITIAPLLAAGEQLVFEMGLYEPKLFQDTTVESKNPYENNAFGSIAYIGDSAAYGEQWLYTKLDFDKIAELLGRNVFSVRLFLPQLSRRTITVEALKLNRRFCSFGSNWANKVMSTTASTASNGENDYQVLSLTELMVAPQTHLIQRFEGLILRSLVKGSGFSAIATGDHYDSPQILEINFK